MGGSIQKTDNIKWMIALRVVAGAPLLLFGVMHLIGAMPMRPLLDEAGIPAAGLMAVVAPLIQIVGGASLLAGAFARVGGMLAIGAMLGAVMTHVKIENDQWPIATTDAVEGPWPEPVFMMYLAIAIIVLSAMVVWKGAGAFSFDRKGSGGDSSG